MQTRQADRWLILGESGIAMQHSISLMEYRLEDIYMPHHTLRCGPLAHIYIYLTFSYHSNTALSLNLYRMQPMYLFCVSIHIIPSATNCIADWQEDPQSQ